MNGINSWKYWGFKTTNAGSSEAEINEQNKSTEQVNTATKIKFCKTSRVLESPCNWDLSEDDYAN